MRRGRVLGVIPARIASERLPQKPLHQLAGKPLIEWVWRRVESLRFFDHLVIATDSDEIADAVRGFGGAVELTSPTHNSGTERIAELDSRDAYAGFDCIVNVQGDEPFLQRDQIATAAQLVLDGWPIGTIATPVGTLDHWKSPSVVKVTRRTDGAALYFSRAPIPFRRDGDPSAAELASDSYLRHIGVYAYAPDALRQWVSLPEHPLERTERLEQLRPLAAGIAIGVGCVASTPEGVDTPEDAARAELLIREMSKTLTSAAET